MEQMERIIKLALKEDLKGLPLAKGPGCPSDSDLAGYLTGHVSRARRKELDLHLSKCPACLEDIVLAKKVQKTESEAKMPKKNLWLILAIVSFILSFIYSRYFLQFLVATLVLAAKWIFDSVNARMLIMIYEAWNRGGEKELSKVLEKVSNRLK